MTSSPSRDLGEDSVVVGVLHFCFAFTRQCEKKPPERTSELKRFWALLKGGENWSIAILAVGERASCLLFRKSGQVRCLCRALIRGRFQQS
jgi:hypothetical protein